MKLIASLPFRLASVLVAVSSAHAGLVNGSFETPDVTGDAPNPLNNNYIYRSVSGTDVTGWTLQGTADPSLFTGEVYGLLPHSGNQALVYGGVGAGPNGGNSIFQTFATIPSTVYTVSYNAAVMGEPHSQFMQTTAYDGTGIGGTTIATSGSIEILELSHQWQEKTLSFTASSALSTIEFKNLGGVGYVDAALALDSVSISAVPEPSAYAGLFAGGLGAFGFYRRTQARRSKALTHSSTAA